MGRKPTRNGLFDVNGGLRVLARQVEVARALVPAERKPAPAAAKPVVAPPAPPKQKPGRKPMPPEERKARISARKKLYYLKTREERIAYAKAYYHRIGKAKNRRLLRESGLRNLSGRRTRPVASSLGERFDGASHAGRVLGCDPANITHAVRFGRKCRMRLWCYVDSPAEWLIAAGGEGQSAAA